MYVIDGIKAQLHRDIAADPRTHGWVLNLYLNGERYPQTVCDYFQSEYAPTRELAEQIRLHEADEHKHELLFAKAIRAAFSLLSPCSRSASYCLSSFTDGP